MGYVAKKVRDTKNGASEVRLRDDGSPYWQVVFENRRGDRPTGTPREQPIHRSQLQALGIDERDNLNRVQEQCRQLNAKARLEAKAERARAGALARQNHEHLIQSAFLPAADAKDFEERILFRRFAGDEEAAKYQRLISHWKYTQRLIADLRLEPKDYADESFQIYRYFQKTKISPAYAVKILRVLNAWGQFTTKRHGGTGIEEVKMPRGKQRQDIARAYQNKEGFKGQAEPLTPQNLEAKQTLLSLGNYNWLRLTVWLGLRPEEVDNLHNPEHWEVRLNADGETKELWVFQTKLVSISEDRAWKPIPLFHKDQVACLKIISSEKFKRPLNKTLRKVFPDSRITGYSGRKGFVDLMLSYGQDLEEIFVWMGHTSIETTWKHYKQKQVVRFKKVA